jgi:hypothetical protein
MPKYATDYPLANPLDGSELIQLVQGEVDVRASAQQIADLAQLSGSFVNSVVAGANISVDNTDPTNPVVSSTALGGGDVVGPSSSYNNRIAVFDGVTGKLLKDSGKTIDQVQRRNLTSLSINSGSVVIDCSLGDYFTISLNSNVTNLSITNPPIAGMALSLAIRIRQDSTGNRTINFPSNFKAITGSDTSVQLSPNSYSNLIITTYDQGARWEYSMKGIAS